MEFENSTEAAELQSGEQAEVVDPQENPTGPASTAGSAGGVYITRTAEAAGQESVVGSRQDDFAMVDADVGESGGASASDPDGAGQGSGQQAGSEGSSQTPAAAAAPKGEPRQTREENAAIRAARIRARRDAEAAAAKAADERFARAGIVNPSTKQPFKSLDEWEEYGRQVKQAEIVRQAKDTGRSVAEVTEEEANREYVSRKRREEAEQNAAQESARAQRAFVENDVLDFVERYPQVDVAALEQNKAFRTFCGSRFGREPLAQLYGDYVSIVGNAGTAAVAKAGSKIARSTGGGTAGGAALTPAQKSVLDKWNEEHPEMAMTAKEFLGR